MTIRYVSTRGGVPAAAFEEVLLAGLAADGGLYVPESWPRLEREDLEELRGASYQQVAARVLAPFVGDALSEAELRRLIELAYASFDHGVVAPLRQIAPNDWLLELFHGPTLAFKDIALQLLGLLFEQVLARRRPVDHHRRCDLGRHRLGRDRRLRRSRAHGSHDPASQGSHLRGAAPPDDHGRGGERAQCRDRGLLR